MSSPECKSASFSTAMTMDCTVRSFTGMDRNGPNYRNGLPEWTLICAIEYNLYILLGQGGLGSPQKAISLRNMQFRYPKFGPVW